MHLTNNLTLVWLLSLRAGNGRLHLGKALDGLLLLVSHLGRNDDLEGHNEVSARSVRQREPEALQSDLLVVGRARLQNHFSHALEGLDFDRATEDRLREGDLLLAVEVVGLVRVSFVLAHVDLDNEVAGLAVQRLVAAVTQPQQHTVVDLRWNRQVQLSGLPQDSGAFAGLAADRVLTVAFGAAANAVVG